MTAIDGGSGDVENTAVLVAHVTYGGGTVDVPMRWRGNTPFPADQYLARRAEGEEMWTGAWNGRRWMRRSGQHQVTRR